MGKWCHVICETCWNKKNPNREPVRYFHNPTRELCCFCGQSTASDIVVREDPTILRCKGVHYDDTVPKT